MPRKQTKKEFITKARKVHGDKYDYANVEYVNAITKVSIRCKTCKKYFMQSPNSHLNGNGCPICADNNKKLLGIKRNNESKDNFIDKANVKHNNFYTYGKTIYSNAKTKVIVTCPYHGDFTITPDNHLRGKGCAKCANENRNKNKTRIARENFIARASKIHNDFYSYELTVYEKSNKLVIVSCPIHGDFKITPESHLRGSGCYSCGKYKAGIKKNANAKLKFISEAKKFHNSYYSYDRVNYKNARTKVTVTCYKHGDFKILPSKHLCGQGCPKCNMSTGEQEVIKYLTSKNISFTTQKKFQSCRNKKPLPFDFYLPRHQILIEFDGQQHFKPVKFFGGRKSLRETQRRDAIKTQWAADNGFTLIRIRYDEDVIAKLDQYLSHLL